MKANKKPSYEITNLSWILFLQLMMYASTYSRYVTRGAARSYPSLSLFLAGGRSALRRTALITSLRTEEL